MLLGANTVSPSFVVDLPGPYVVQLIVNDGVQNSAPATVMITAGAAAITLTPNPLNLTLAPQNLTITIGSPAGPGGVTVAFSGYDPAVVSLPANVVIPQSATSTTVPVTPVAPGDTNVLATASGFQSGTAAVSVNTPGIALTLNAGAVGLTHVIGGTITLSAPAPVATIVSLSANPTGQVTLSPSAVTIAAGATTGTAHP